MSNNVKKKKLVMCTERSDCAYAKSSTDVKHAIIHCLSFYRERWRLKNLDSPFEDILIDESAYQHLSRILSELIDEAKERAKFEAQATIKDSVLTRYCVRLRLEGVSYPKIVRDLIDRGYSPMSWQSIQNRVNRYKNKL